MSKPLFSSLLANSVEFETWPFINVDVWFSSFLSNGKVFPTWVDRYRTNTISVGTMEDSSFLGLDVEDLVCVTCCVYEIIITKPVVVISF
jgi:hypothetical protein